MNCKDCKWYYYDNSFREDENGLYEKDEDMCELIQHQTIGLCSYFEKRTENISWGEQSKLADEKRKKEGIQTYHEWLMNRRF